MGSIIFARHAALTSSHKHKSVYKAREIDRLWDAALESYYDVLGDDDEEADIADEVNSLQDVINYAQTRDCADNGTHAALSRLEPTLKLINNFVAIVALYKDPNSHAVAVIWTSLLRIIALVTPVNNAMQNVLFILGDLSLSLPRTRHYECGLPTDGPLEVSIVSVYAKMICSFASIIRQHKLNEDLPLHKAAWQDYQRNLVSSLERIKILTSAVEKNLELVEVKMEKARQDQTLRQLETWSSVTATNHTAKQRHYIPVFLNRNFQGRGKELWFIEQALQHEAKPASLKCLVLYGVGGVGKTQLALKYALYSKTHFDNVLWIAAETTLSLEQSFYEATIELGLSDKSETGFNKFAAVARVRNWLHNNKSDKPWLLIYDNVDDINVLRNAWPTNASGSILIVSRHCNTLSTLNPQGLEVKPLSRQAGADLLLQLTGTTNPSPTQRTEAATIAERVDGLPLALNQVASFIAHRQMHLRDFLPLCDRYTAPTSTKCDDFIDFLPSLQTIFDLTFSQLEGSAYHLQNLLAFLEPDSISTDLLHDGTELVTDPDFGFLSDVLESGIARAALLKTSFINDYMEGNSFSVSRVVQTATLQRLDQSMQRKYFAVATDLLRLGFPNSWSKDVDQHKVQWDRCERYLPHVNRLVRLVTGSVDIVERPDSWADLLLRSSWYLYEKEQYEYAEAFVIAAMSSHTLKETLAYANATELLGLIHLNICEPRKALEAFERCLSIRQRSLSPTDSLIALSFNNLGLAFTELPDLEAAAACHRKATEIHLMDDSDCVSESYSNYASLLLRLDQPVKAEKVLLNRPYLANWTISTYLETDNPRFIGDTVLLSRIYRAQGRRSASLQLANKALNMRKTTNGDRFKTCDVMYDVASLLYEDRKQEAALNLLNQLVIIAETLPWGEGQAARAEYKMSVIYARVQKFEESHRHQDNALRLRAIYRPEEAASPYDEDSFDRLNMFMMW